MLFTASRTGRALAHGAASGVVVSLAFLLTGLSALSEGEQEPTSPVPTDLSREDAANTLHNPLPYDPSVITSGKKHYLRHCQSCHGFDGRALENIDFEAADLTRPSAWRFGSSDGEIFLTTRDGVGLDMPPFDKLDDNEIWQLLHYLRSIGPEELRPDRSPDP